jgi:hypothetical protein
MDGGSGNAIEIAGGIKVSGSNKAAFVLTADNTNLSGLGYVNPIGVRINNALCNNDPNAMIFVTQIWRQSPVSLGIGSGTSSLEYGAPVYPYYNSSDGYWYVVHYLDGVAGYRDGGFTPNEITVAPVAGSQYNILIIKQ